MCRLWRVVNNFTETSSSFVQKSAAGDENEFHEKVSGRSDTNVREPLPTSTGSTFIVKPYSEKYLYLFFIKRVF